MKHKLMATIIVAIVLTLSIINFHGIAFAHRYHNSDFQDNSGQGGDTSSDGQQQGGDTSSDGQQRGGDTGGSQLLCYAAGGLLLLGGVPAPAVFGAGAAAHHIGLCP